MNQLSPVNNIKYSEPTTFESKKLVMLEIAYSYTRATPPLGWKRTVSLMCPTLHVPQALEILTKVVGSLYFILLLVSTGEWQVLDPSL